MADTAPLEVLDDLEQVVAMVERSDVPLFVRFSKPPPEGLEEPSVDGETGLELPGLSVNPLDPPSWWRGNGLAEWIARRICSYAHLQADDPARVCLLLSGSVVERGPDNEPLLAGAEAVAIVSGAAVDECRKQRLEAGLDRPDDSGDPPPWQGSAANRPPDAVTAGTAP
jgi:hypothetical protein